MDKIFSQLPKEIEREIKDTEGNPSTVFSGLCLKYLTNEQKWVCTYGTPKSGAKLAYMQEDKGVGDSAKEALENFVGVFKR